MCTWESCSESSGQMTKSMSKLQKIRGNIASLDKYLFRSFFVFKSNHFKRPSQCVAKWEIVDFLMWNGKLCLREKKVNGATNKKKNIEGESNASETKKLIRLWNILTNSVHLLKFAGFYKDRARNCKQPQSNCYNKIAPMSLHYHISAHVYLPMASFWFFSIQNICKSIQQRICTQYMSINHSKVNFFWKKNILRNMHVGQASKGRAL